MSNTSSSKLHNTVSAMEGSFSQKCKNGCQATRTGSSKRSMVRLRWTVAVPLRAPRAPTVQRVGGTRAPSTSRIGEGLPPRVGGVVRDPFH